MDMSLRRVDSGVDATPYGPIKSEEGEIRLLEVHPGRYDDDMVVSLKRVKLSDKPVYPVLSYVWGHSMSTRPCIVDGIPMPVTRNLFNFLTYLRDFVDKRTMWIDALCINQADLDERAAQVRQMKAIYEGAAHIYGWVGLPLDNEEARQAIIMMRECNKFLRESLQANNDDINLAFSNVSARLSCFPGNATAWMGWNGIARICESQFWERTWIYQEVTTPKKISFWYGHHDFDDILICAATSMACHFSKLPEFPKRFLSCRGNALHLSETRIDRKKGRHRTLIGWMQEMRISVCTDHRDRVYAPLGHAIDVPVGRFAIDYKTGIDTLFLDVARYSIMETATELGTLGYVFTPTMESGYTFLRSPKRPFLPSWVPDWRQRIYLASPISSFTDAETINAPLYTPLPGPPSICINGPQLHVEGCIVQDVGIATLTTIWDQADRSWRTPHRWYTELSAKSGDSPSLQTAIRRSLVANCIAQRNVGMNTEQGFNYKRGGSVDWQVLKAESSSVQDPSAKILSHAMFTNMYNISYGRRLGVLSDGRVAVFPAAAKLSHRIAAFCGGHALYLLEVVPEDQRKYRFVGECYVDGWMDGELVNGTQPAAETLVLV